MVGLDDTPASRAAVRWAAAEATRRSTTLYALHVHDDAGHADAHAFLDCNDVLTAERARAPRRVGDWLATGSAHPDLAVSVISGPLAQTLSRSARAASMVVLGASTSPAHQHLADCLAATCHCTVAVVDDAGTVSFTEDD